MGRSDADTANRIAMLCAAAVIAQQVGAKATRDAMFLSSFEVSALPTIIMASALSSIALALLVSRALAALGPRRLVPAAFAASGVLLLVLWVVARLSPRLAAAAVYIHVAAFGSLLASGFWSVVSERFDPRTAKKWIGRIAGAGTAGGLAGGLTAERVAAHLGIVDMLLVLAALHLGCAVLVRLLTPPGDPGVQARAVAGASAPRTSEVGALGLVARDPYLRSIALLVMLGAIAQPLLDYFFKLQAVAAYHGGPPLMRFFAAFYTGVGLLSFLAQLLLGRVSLERLGLAKTVAALPLGVAAGGLGMLLAPGLAGASAARGMEGVLRGSLYRLGYELLYTPLPRRHKRATKTVVDVAFDRVGELLGAGALKLVLLAVPLFVLPTLAAAVVVLGVLGFLLATRLSRGYVHALEQSLLSRAVQLDLADVVDKTTRTTLMRSLGPVGTPQDAADGRRSPSTPRPLDPSLAQLGELRSGDPERVRRALDAGIARDPLLAPHVIALLAWDDVAEGAVMFLRGMAPRITGQLIDALLDPEQEFSVRRRIPRVLGASRSQRAADGLLLGLQDARFEVRFECGRALSRFTEGPVQVRIDPERVFSAVLREAAVDRRLWESQQLIGPTADGDAAFVLDSFLRDRGQRSMEHVFRLLSLALPKDALLIAYRGLHTDDEGLRGTALEYLESVLPEAVRRSLWPFLEDDRRPERPARSRDEILRDLLRSNASIAINLEALAKKARGGEPEGGVETRYTAGDRNPAPSKGGSP